MTRKRPFLAGLLAVLYPGLGHIYLRAWKRALGWFLLAIATVALVVPPEVIESVDPLDSPFAISETVATAASAGELTALLIVVGFSVADAYLLARRQPASQSADETYRCPNCNKELAEELDFCPWCATELDEPTSQ